MIAGVFEAPGWVLKKFYEFTSDYIILDRADRRTGDDRHHAAHPSRAPRACSIAQPGRPRHKRLQQLYRNDRARSSTKR